MSLMSVRLPEATLKHLEICSKHLHLSKAAYIRKAIETMNRDILRSERQQRLQDASQRVRESSQCVSQEVEAIEHDPDL